MKKKELKKNIPFFILILLISVLIGFFLSTNYSKKNHISLLNSKFEKIQNSINSILSKNISTINKLSADKNIIGSLINKDINSSKEVQFIINTAQNILDAEMIYIMDKDGLVVSSTRFNGVSFLGNNYSFRPYFKQAYKYRRLAQYAALGLTSNRRGIYLSMPIFNNNIVIGIIVIKQGIEQIEKIIQKKDGIIALESPDKIIFCSNKQELLYRFITPISNDKIREIEDSKQFSNKKLTQIKLNELNQKNIKKFFHQEYPLKLNGWKLLTIIKIPETLLLSNEEWLIIISICLFFVFLGALLLLLLIRLSQKISLHKSLSEHAKVLEDINVKQSKKLSDTNKALIDEIGRSKEADENRIKAEVRFHEVAEMIPEMVYEATLDGKMIYANHSGMIKFGYEKSDLSGLTVFDILKEKELIISNIEKLIQGEKIGTHEYTAIRKDGSEFPITASSVVMFKDNKPIGLRGVVIDITQQKQAELERERLIEHLKDEQKMNALGTLSSGIAHNFNNQLTIIQGFALLIKKQLSADSPLLNDISKIINASKSSEKLVRKLLEFSKKNKNNKEKSSLDINKILIETLEMFGATNKRIKIVNKVSRGSCLVNADKSDIEQVFLNMLINAGYAMPDGGCITISTQSIDLSKKDSSPLFLSPGKFVIISIEDNGIGIDEETIKKIFDPFFSTKPTGVGTGLGLSTAYGTIKALNGTIIAKSQLGMGTSFNIYIPESDILHSDKGHSESIQLLKNKKLKILIADDEEEICSLLSRMLLHLGHTVESFNTGNKLVEYLKSSNCQADLIITDVIMPGLFGKRLFKELVKICDHAKIIFMSAHDMGENMRNIDSSPNFYGFLDKPFTLEKISNMIKDIT